MSICNKCVYSGHCLLEVSSVPTKCEMYNERVAKAAKEEKMIGELPLS